MMMREAVRYLKRVVLHQRITKPCSKERGLVSPPMRTTSKSLKQELPKSLGQEWVAQNRTRRSKATRRATIIEALKISREMKRSPKALKINLTLTAD
jgi:hypothetical protein